jgi:hypothetical protein
MDPMSPPKAPAPDRRRSGGSVISVSSDGNYEEFSLDQPPAEARPAPPPKPRITNGETVDCPSCGATNPGTNLHCQNCGARLRQGPLPTAPRPAVQATAGVRAALAISGLLLAVILVALVFNLFGGTPDAATSTTLASSTTSPTQAENSPIEVIRVDCTSSSGEPQGLGSFACSNLIAGEGTEFQVSWEELELAEESLIIKLYFLEPMLVSEIQWVNIADPTRFQQNHRARGLLLNSDNQVAEYVTELTDTPGFQVVDYAALNSTWIEITINSTFHSEVTEGNVFGDLAIDEIVVYGRPALETEG